jgi:putative endonuclease
VSEKPSSSASRSSTSDELLWVVYLVRCSDDSLYCGMSKDLDNRIKMHNSGKGSKYTRGRLPVVVVATTRKMTQYEAIRLELKIKSLRTQEAKLNYINGLRWRDLNNA